MKLVVRRTAVHAVEIAVPHVAVLYVTLRVSVLVIVGVTVSGHVLEVYHVKDYI